MNLLRSCDVDLAAQWAESRQLVTTGNGDGEFCEWALVDSLELAVLSGEIRSVEDAVAKLKAVQLAFADGPRSDGADAAALRQTIAWLESESARSARRSAA